MLRAETCELPLLGIVNKRLIERSAGVIWKREKSAFPTPVNITNLSILVFLGKLLPLSLFAQKI